MRPAGAPLPRSSAKCRPAVGRKLLPRPHRRPVPRETVTVKTYLPGNEDGTCTRTASIAPTPVSVRHIVLDNGEYLVSLLTGMVCAQLPCMHRKPDSQAARLRRNRPYAIAGFRARMKALANLPATCGRIASASSPERDRNCRASSASYTRVTSNPMSVNPAAASFAL